MASADYRRFHGAASHAGEASSPENARALVMYYTHSIEKGLSRSDIRPGFGRKQISKLADLLNEWVTQNRSIDDTFFASACSALHDYFNYHEKLDLAQTEKWNLFLPIIQDLISKSDKTAAVRDTANRADPPTSFADLAERRVSLREFSSDGVDITLVYQALKVATLAPSACNRQATRIHLVTSPQIIDSILKIQAGLRGYRRPPLLILVTADASCYVEATERNQPYVDGALFAMSLIYALEELQIGTCALTAMLWPRNEESVRRILRVPSSECFVTFIALGSKSDIALIPHSQRENITDILTIH